MAEHKSNFIEAEDLRPILKFIGKNWYLLILLPAVFGLGALAYTNGQAEIYAARCEILLKSSETYDYQSQIYSNLGYYSVLADVTNQKRVITSFDLISRSLKKLNYTTSYFLVGRINTRQYPSFKALLIDCDPSKMAPELFDHPFTIRVLDLDHYSLTYEYNDRQITQTNKFGEMVDNDTNFPSCLTIDKTGLIDEQSLSGIKEQTFQFKVAPINYLNKKFKANLSVENIEFTSILTLTCQDEMESRAKQFLDTLAHVYIDYTQEEQITVNEKTQVYIDKQLDEITYIIDSLELQVELYH